MPKITLRRYIYSDGKARRIGIRRELHMPEKAHEKIAEMFLFLDPEGQAFELQLYYNFLDENGNVDYTPHDKEAAYILGKKLSRLFDEEKDPKVVQLPAKVKPPAKYSPEVQAFADVFVEKKYGSKAVFNLLLDRYLRAKNAH